MKAKELRSEVPSYVIARKDNMIAWKLKWIFNAAHNNFMAGETMGHEPKYNSSSCQQIVKASLKNKIPKKVYDLLPLDEKMCIPTYIPTTYIQSASYYSQRAILFEIMKKKAGVADIYIIGLINSFLTDYTGDVGNVNPILKKIKMEDNDDNKQFTILINPRIKKIVRKRKLKITNKKQFDPCNEDDIISFCKALRK